MENVWLYIIGPIIGAIAGSFGTLIFLPQERKSKILANEAKQSEEWHKLYVEEKERREEDRKNWENERGQYEQKIDHLYHRISEVRNEKAAVTKVNTQLEVENTKLCLLKCEAPNCPNRKPPTGY